ncbi:MAG: hypothetical protein K1X53_11575 [Candidatus Sumerlaeaceae bacterium]|nr:hypothetical protein [Candidatus Sumerlaeaceae bacterium]
MPELKLGFLESESSVTILARGHAFRVNREWAITAKAEGSAARKIRERRILTASFDGRNTTLLYTIENSGEPPKRLGHTFQGERRMPFELLTPVSAFNIPGKLDRYQFTETSAGLLSIALPGKYEFQLDPATGFMIRSGELTIGGGRVRQAFLGEVALSGATLPESGEITEMDSAGKPARTRFFREIRYSLVPDIDKALQDSTLPEDTLLNSEDPVFKGYISRSRQF